MQQIKNSGRFDFKTLILFAIVLFIAFLPISGFFFYIKNDAFSNYFPAKFFMSESIHAGYLPLWNPYINFGIPQYGDMNAGYWSPVTWLIAGTVGYNAYSFTLELLLYILLGGWGMYKLSGHWIQNKNICILTGLAFMCCGYHIAHLQHFNWISASAFLPWCFWSYLNLIHKRTVTTTLTSVLLFYLFIASAHPGLIIGAFYFFLAILFFSFFKNDQGTHFKKRLLQYCTTQLFFILAMVLLSAGIIAGYSDIIPHFIRGEKISLESSLPHSSNIKTWISLLLPFSTVKNNAFFDTELTLRNSYFSLTFLLFLVVAVVSKKSRWQKFLLFLGLTFALLSAGGPVKIFAHHYIPFIGYVRLAGEFRIFAIIAFIIVAAIELNKYFSNEQNNESNKLKWISYILGIILITCCCWALYNIIINNQSILFNLANIQSFKGFPEKTKYIIDTISFYDALLIQGFIQLILLSLVYRSMQSKKIRMLRFLLIADIILSSLLNIPYTGVGKTTVSHLQSVINLSPKGIPIPPLQPVKNNDTIPASENALIGNWSMYNKQIGTTKEMPYPIQLNNMRTFFDSTLGEAGAKYFEKPFLYTNEGNADITILNFSPNEIRIRVVADSTSKLVVLQNEYPHWIYAKNGVIQKVGQEGFNFMAVPVNKGKNEIVLLFKPTHIKIAMYISALVFILYIFIIVFYKTKRI